MDHRDYTELAVLSPQVTKSPNGGLSFAGQHDRFNSIQIDGTNNNDPFGRSISGNGTPGWAVGLTAFTPEAVKELQVVSAPFDVRYGNFAGGLINAVTQLGLEPGRRLDPGLPRELRSHRHRRDRQPGERVQPQGARPDPGRAHRAGPRRACSSMPTCDGRSFPRRCPLRATPAATRSAGVGIRYESLVRFQDLLRSYGVEPGSFSAGAYSTPTRNLFVKVTAQLG